MIPWLAAMRPSSVVGWRLAREHGHGVVTWLGHGRRITTRSATRVLQFIDFIFVALKNKDSC